MTYYLSVRSHYEGYPVYRHLVDEAWDSVTIGDLAIGHYYINVVHSHTEYYGGYDEYSRGDCEWDNGFGVWTPWGWIPIQQWHHTCHIWVYASGYWTWEFV